MVAIIEISVLCGIAVPASAWIVNTLLEIINHNNALEEIVNAENDVPIGVMLTNGPDVLEVDNPQPVVVLGERPENEPPQPNVNPAGAMVEGEPNAVNHRLISVTPRDPVQDARHRRVRRRYTVPFVAKVVAHCKLRFPCPEHQPTLENKLAAARHAEKFMTEWGVHPGDQARLLPRINVAVFAPSDEEIFSSDLERSWINQWRRRRATHGTRFWDLFLPWRTDITPSY